MSRDYRISRDMPKERMKYLFKYFFMKGIYFSTSTEKRKGADVDCMKQQYGGERKRKQYIF